MKHALEEDLLLRRFLLGELSGGERGEVEERLFADPEYFRQFRAAEDELTDEYLYGDLDADERGRFETYFLTTPERRESLRVASALKQYIAKNAVAPVAEPAAASAPADTPARADAAHVPRREKKSLFDFLRAPRFALAAAAVLIVAVGLWLLLRSTTRDKPDPTLKANTSDARPTPTQLAEATPGQDGRGPVVETPPAENSNGDANRSGGVRGPKHPRQTPSRVYAFLILPLGQVRGEGHENDVNEVSIPSDAGAVNLRIPLIADPGRARYRVTLQTDAGRAVKTWANLKPSEGEMGGTVSVNVPASTLTQRDYRLVLATTAGETVGAFRFKVTRQR